MKKQQLAKKALAGFVLAMSLPVAIQAGTAGTNTYLAGGSCGNGKCGATPPPAQSRHACGAESKPVYTNQNPGMVPVNKEGSEKADWQAMEQKKPVDGTTAYNNSQKRNENNNYWATETTPDHQKMKGPEGAAMEEGEKNGKMMQNQTTWNSQPRR